MFSVLPFNPHVMKYRYTDTLGPSWLPFTNIATYTAFVRTPYLVPIILTPSYPLTPSTAKDVQIYWQVNSSHIFFHPQAELRMDTLAG